MFVYGGSNGLEAGLESDEKLKANKLEQLFDFVCQSHEYQIFGSRSLRLEVKFKLIFYLHNYFFKLNDVIY